METVERRRVAVVGQNGRRRGHQVGVRRAAVGAEAVDGGKRRLRHRGRRCEGEIGDGVGTLEFDGGFVVLCGGFLRRVECSEPEAFPAGRVADLGGPSPPRPLTDAAELGAASGRFGGWWRFFGPSAL